MRYKIISITVIKPENWGGGSDEPTSVMVSIVDTTNNEICRTVPGETYLKEVGTNNIFIYVDSKITDQEKILEMLKCELKDRGYEKAEEMFDRYNKEGEKDREEYNERKEKFLLEYKKKLESKKYKLKLAK